MEASEAHPKWGGAAKGLVALCRGGTRGTKGRRS